jgi:TolB protein
MQMRTSHIAGALVVAAVVLLFVFHPWRTGPSIVSDEPVTTYASDIYKIEFKYPISWKKVPGDSERYEGNTGFFVVSAANGELTLNSILASEAQHVLSPYGSDPSTDTLMIDGEPAGIIMPSDDQDASMKGQAALIVSYPTPVKIRGQEYGYLVLWADKGHIRQIADTIVFK